MKNKKSYHIGKDSSGTEQVVMVGTVRDNEHYGYIWHEIIGDDGADLGDLLEEYNGKRVKVVVSIYED